MPTYFYLIIAFAVAAAFSLVTMPWLLRICHRFSLYDLPSERKVHKSGIPRLGGIVFVPAVLTGTSMIASITSTASTASASGILSPKRAATKNIEDTSASIKRRLLKNLCGLRSVNTVKSPHEQRKNGKTAFILSTIPFIATLP